MKNGRKKAQKAQRGELKGSIKVDQGDQTSFCVLILG